MEVRFISRRDFLRGSMAAVAVTGLSGISYAFAEEATASIVPTHPAPYTRS